MKKFDIDFRSSTNNKYPFIRFVRADYSTNNNSLTIFFITKASAVDSGILSEDIKKEINMALVPFLPDDITFSVRFTKVNADEDSVRVKLMTALQKYVGQIVQSIKNDDISIGINDYVIDIKIKAVKAYYSMLKSDEIKTNIINDLEDNFVENINLDIIEKYISDDEKQKIIEKSVQTVENAGFNCNISVSDDGKIKEDVNKVFEDLIDPFSDTIIVYENTRQIKADPLENLVGKAYMNTLPTYISDIKDTTESATLCGKVQGLEKREYKNKNFGLDLPTGGRFKKNTTDEKLPMYSFVIDDTTGKISVVYFAKDTLVNKLDVSLREDKDVVVTGKISERNGNKQIIVDKMWLANVDYSTIKNDKPKKAEPKNYYLIKPEKYYEESQCDMMELMTEKKEISPALKGKTYVVFDLETTGLDVSSCSIVQLGSYKIVDGKIVETFNTLVNPLVPIPEKASEIHGIYDDDVKNAPEFREVLPDFYKFTRGATLVGHNLFGYDLPILNRYAKENGYTFDNPALDTLVIAKNNCRLSSNNLSALSKHFNIDLECAHNADFDAIATAKLFIIFAEKYL